MTKETPMMKQYKEIKAQYEETFLFFRLGDFYELFFEDAVKAAKLLEITLTKRGTGEEAIPMCGVPYHSAESYISELIGQGYKIAICEQVEDPQTAKGVVKREVVRIITPGTVMEGKALEAKDNQYIGALDVTPGEQAAWVKADLTTGEISASLLSPDDLAIGRELSISGLREVVIAEEIDEKVKQQIQEHGLIESVEEEIEPLAGWEDKLVQISNVTLRQAAVRLLHYLHRTQKRSLDHLQAIQVEETTDFLLLDVHAKKNLELLETLRDKTRQGSLLAEVDQTATAMGGRLLKRWLERPLLDQTKIERRQGLVEAWKQDMILREDLREALTGVYDLERLVGKVAYQTVNARDLVQLRSTLESIPAIKALVEETDHEHADRLSRQMKTCDELKELLDRALVSHPPVSILEGGMIRTGYHAKLDEYREASQNGKTWISNLEQEERQVTGVKSLKVGYNKVFGYYIEVTKPNIAQLPQDRYERKQTLTNAERFVTPELKEKERLILEAETEIGTLEHELFVELRERVKEEISTLQELSILISEVDVLQGFAKVSDVNDYHKPTFTAGRTLTLTASRHPVVEQTLGSGEYVANNVYMDEERELLIITGPNMSGKSTYMRQVALTAIMAQIGCFVPAKEAELPVFDQIFTRIGAADDLASGQSTFMVEMVETKHALMNATNRSLLLLDEIGRGTSTYDGMALAQSILEYIHNTIGAKTLFSTHYHELTALADELPAAQNVHVAASEENEEVVFLHEVQEGRADKSYGIHVAKLAQLPTDVLYRAQTVLEELETAKGSDVAPSSSQEAEQLPLFTISEEAAASSGEAEELSPEKQKIIAEVECMDVLNMTPFEALQIINDWQHQLKQNNKK
ncbi:DNA mismatch repair protein MutS [Salsuginibacillus kocurii]|uniref:DNA mismatch repair protein MutS n=1 Tax=Salsuginibacillus kocurii TaxID=427078 RepID=UPI00035F3B89|nr:DNA mismatch repair protein MutS [Salsuginibacillus kocurii]